MWILAELYKGAKSPRVHHLATRRFQRRKVKRKMEEMEPTAGKEQERHKKLRRMFQKP
jgi:hypothetical protein